MSCFGTLNAATFTTARLIYAAARERHLLSLFGELHSEHLTPARALVLSSGLTSLMIIIGNISSLLTINGILECFWFFVRFSFIWSDLKLTVLVVLVLRYTEPHLERFGLNGSTDTDNRPYKVLSFTPVFFCLVTLYLSLSGVVSAPLHFLFAIIFLAVAVGAYYRWIAHWSFPVWSEVMARVPGYQRVDDEQRDPQ